MINLVIREEAIFILHFHCFSEEKQQPREFRGRGGEGGGNEAENQKL